MNSYLEKIKSLGLVLPPVPKPAGSYHPVVFSETLAFLSGQLCRKSNGSLITGKIGRELTLAQGQEAAKIAALNVLSVIHERIGFDKFDRILRLVGYVQVSPDFYEISSVMNGASDFFLEALGEKGIHARSAVGMASLPLNAAVEIEATIQIRI